MITISSITGNIHRDQKLWKKYEEALQNKTLEKIKISRMESQRVRMRKTSDKGTDIALTLPQGTTIRHGDVIMLTEDNGNMVIVEIEPENVAQVEVKDNIDRTEVVEVPVRIGHTIGNLHRPIRTEGRKIYFPIQADSELDMFRKLFAPVSDHLDIKKVKMVFEPEEGTEVHEH